jgi:hypothetical protein
MFKIFDCPFGKAFNFFQYARTFSYGSIYFLQFMVIWYLGLKVYKTNVVLGMVRI